MQGGPGVFRGRRLLRSDGQQGMAANGRARKRKKPVAVWRATGRGAEIIP